MPHLVYAVICNSYVVCASRSSSSNLYEGIEISLVNTGLLQENSITFTVGEMGSSTYNAQVMEYNLDDTVMLTSVVLDRPQEYTLSFKPNGSGVMKLLISSLADASDVIGIYGLTSKVNKKSNSPEIIEMDLSKVQIGCYFLYVSCASESSRHFVIKE